MPILALESVCYGECAYLWPAGLSQVAVYDDGSVSIARDVHVGAQWSVGMFGLTLTPQELEEIRTAAHTGGLDAGGLHVAGTTAGSADGGGSVFFARSANTPTVVEAAQLFDDDMITWGDGEPQQRRELFAVKNMLTKIADRPDAKPVEPSAFVMVVAPAEPAAQPGVTPIAWPGATPLSATEARPGHTPCELVAAKDAPPDVVDELSALGFAKLFTSGGTTWSVQSRPLMAHEKTCDDVEAWSNVMAAEQRAKLVNPSGQ